MPMPLALSDLGSPRKYRRDDFSKERDNLKKMHLVDISYLV